jgi:hypothetical protein
MNLLCIENFSSENLSQIIRDLQFVDKPLGKEIDCFNFVDPSYEELFSSFLRQKVSLPKHFGAFRKSSPTIHFEDHSGMTLFSAIIAIDDVTFKTYKHKETEVRTVYDLPPSAVPDFIQKNSNAPDNWTVENQIFVPKHSLFFFESWYWHSFSDGIIQRFLVERPPTSNKIDETTAT